MVANEAVEEVVDVVVGGLGLCRRRGSHSLCVLTSLAQPLPPIIWSHSRPDCGRSPTPTKALVGGRYHGACVCCRRASEGQGGLLGCSLPVRREPEGPTDCLWWESQARGTMRTWPAVQQVGGAHAYLSAGVSVLCGAVRRAL